MIPDEARLAPLRAVFAEHRVQPPTFLAWLAEVDSTNAVLLREAAHLPDRAALIADAQTHGRGRRGRAWTSPADGNLYLSVFARSARPFSALGPLSLVAGIAIAETLRDAGCREVALKWPNDLVARERKLGGVLVEALSARNGASEFVVGVGLNIRMPASAAEAIDQPWIDLSELGLPMERHVWGARLIVAIQAAIDASERGDGASWLARFDSVDALAKAAIWVENGAGRLAATAHGVDADGALKVKIDAAVVSLYSGEVSVRRR